MISMRVMPLDVKQLPSPYHEILGREVEKLKKNDDVLAIGLAGSVARNDLWHGADLDIEVVVKGDKPKHVVCTEQEISVDYAYFAESCIEDLPHDTAPSTTQHRFLQITSRIEPRSNSCKR